MFKFINDRDNAPSFHTVSFVFDHDVDYSKDLILDTHVNLALTHDNIPVIYLNSFGLGYKHSDKFVISVEEGVIFQHITKQDPERDGRADYLYLSSPSGKIKISDSFTHAYIVWDKDEHRVQIETSGDNDSVVIDYIKGVIDPNIVEYVDFLFEIYAKAPEALQPSMMKKIMDIKNKFGLLEQ